VEKTHVPYQNLLCHNHIFALILRNDESNDTIPDILSSSAF
jgi:hypothetical protein